MKPKDSNGQELNEGDIVAIRGEIITDSHGLLAIRVADGHALYPDPFMHIELLPPAANPPVTG